MHTIIRAELRNDWDNGDAWGSAMSSWHSIADVLYIAGESIPNDWAYHNPWPPAHVVHRIYDEDNGDWLAADLREAYYTNLVTADDLRHAGNVLARYSNILDAAGRSY